MSGIFGVIGGETEQSSVIDRMSQMLAHRGPDDEHKYIRPGKALGCRRLSIQDVEGGRQPQCNEDETIWIVLNGEIYNCNELRSSLEHKGHVFRTRSDTEVVLNAYEAFGVDCVRRLRGMFAFAIWDHRCQQLVLARDHLGQKPIYFATVGEHFYFASEPKALTAAQSSLRDCDYEFLSHYLSLRFVPAPGTMLRGIKKLPPAHWLIHKGGQTEISRYWTPTFSNKLNGSEEKLLKGLEEKLAETVSSHLVGEVPVGAFLSGGLDSSLIVAMMARKLSTPFSTFSVGVTDPKFNELPYARLVADRFKTHHFETNAETDFVRSIATIIWHLDEPSDPVAASKFIASKLAAEHVKVVLGGDGGDELFAGFDRYRGVQQIEAYAHLPSFIRNNIIGSIARILPASFGYDSLSQKLRWVNRVGSVEGLAERFAEAVSFFRFRHDEKELLFTKAVWQQIKDVRTNSLLVNTLSESDAMQPVERMLYADYLTRLPEHSLMLTDRLGMAHGLEVRSPLVDKELVEYLAAFPLSMKIRRGQTKYGGRVVAKQILPSAVSRRAKRGFRFPLARWFGNELYPYLKRVFSDSQMTRDQIINYSYLARLMEEHRERKVDHHVRLWMLLNLEIWYRLTIHGFDRQDVTEWLLDA